MSTSAISGPSTPVLVQEGKVPFIVEGEFYETWYKVYGKLAPSDPESFPLVVLHGGKPRLLREFREDD